MGIQHLVILKCDDCGRAQQFETTLDGGKEGWRAAGPDLARILCAKCFKSFEDGRREVKAAGKQLF